jgi:RecA-family ATPase
MMHIPPASELTLPSVEWLWPGYLPLEHLVLLDGDPGLGKSLVALDLCARVTTGRPFPDGTGGGPPDNVLLICAEDPPGVILSRLRALSADLTRVFLWPRDADGGLPRFPTDGSRLERVLEQTDARLVVFDPLVAFLESSVSLASDLSVRAVLDALGLVAARRHGVFLLLRHLNKKMGQAALYRGGGSIAFVAACRLAWLAFTHPHTPGRCILAQNKNNYAPLQSSL